MLKGQAKTDYQRRYMRVKRSKLKLDSVLLDPSTLKVVRPVVQPVRPFITVPNKQVWITLKRGIQYPEGSVIDLDADGNPIYEEG